MIIYVFLIAIIIGIFFIFVGIKIEASSKSEGLRGIQAYSKKESVMNQSEAAFFFELQRQLPEGYYIFPKMRIADMLDIPNGHDYYRMRNKILPKHIDFLVCDKNFKPAVAIEINGASHNSFKQQEADRIKNDMFKDSGLPLETIDVGNSFNEAISRLQHYFV